MTFSLRPVQSDDLAAICRWPETATELYYCFPKARYPLTVGQLSAAIAQRAESTVVCLSNRPVAFANFYRWELGGVCAIGNVMVDSSARRLGAASMLVEHLCRIAFDRYGASEVRVSCFNHNTAGLLLYPKLGFMPTSIEPREGLDGERLALIHMRRER